MKVLWVTMVTISGLCSHTQKFLVYASLIDLHSSVNKNQVYSGPFAPTWTHTRTHDHDTHRFGESRAYRADALPALVQPVIAFLSQPVHYNTQFSEDFWVWLHKPEMVTMVNHRTFITLKTYNINFLGRVSCNRKWLNFKFEVP